MALLFCDGFDHYTYTLNGTLVKWDRFGSAGNGSQMTVGSGQGRPSIYDSLTGGLGSAGGDGITTGYAQFSKNLLTNASTLCAGFALYWTYTTPGGATNVGPTTLITFQDGLTSQTDLRVNVLGQFFFTRNGTQIGSTTTKNIQAAQWRSIQVKVTFGTTGGSCELLVDGQSWLLVTNVNTSTTGNAYANWFSFGVNGNGSAAMYCRFDDLWVCDTTSSYNNNYLGDVRIRAATPAGNGTYQNYTYTAATWTASTGEGIYTIIFDGTNLQQCTVAGTTGSSAPTWNTTVGSNTTDGSVHWKNIGPPSAWKYISDTYSDGDNSYILDSTVGDQSTFTFSPVVGNSVLAVVAYVLARKDDAGIRSIRLLANSNSSLVDSGSDQFLSATNVYYAGVFNTDPSTGAAWTVSSVNNAEFGVKTTT